MGIIIHDASPMHLDKVRIKMNQQNPGNPGKRWWQENRHSDLRGYSLEDRMGNIHDVYIISQPYGLDDLRKQRLVDVLTPVTGRGFLRYDVEGNSLRQDVENHVLGCDRLVICMCEGEVSCFVAASLREFGEFAVYHLEGVIVEPQFQSAGLALLVMKEELVETSADILAFHTQSIKMVRLGNKLATLNRQLAIEVADLIHTSNQSGAIDIGRYGGQSLYDNPTFAEVAIKSLNWQNGDALICAGWVGK